jgi:putative membrane protein insertion efficiency factor
MKNVLSFLVILWNKTFGALLSALFVVLIRLYQVVLSPLLGQRCRYYPSCSNYSLQAIRAHGSFKGLALSVWRVLRCNPWSEGGIDPVPGHGTWSNSQVIEFSTKPLGMV